MKNLPFRLLISPLFVAVFTFSSTAQNNSAEAKPVSINVNVDANKTLQKVKGLFGKKPQTPQTTPDEPVARVKPAAQSESTQPSQTMAQPESQTVPTPSATIAADKSFGGDWKMSVALSESLSSDGQRNEAKGTHEIGTLLKIEGARFTGDYTWAKGVCAIAHIEGAMTGANTFEAVVEYSGGCCGGSKMRLTGSFTSSTTFTAKFKPEGRPGAWCQTWWATIQGVKE